ncbi:Methylmalonyl-CoA epimerase [Candidatus Anstonella stagnisolia]|nr:Methylmalonyl-CoA epimerase [Candidatus Anstonella stagnisolia]
MRVHHIAITVKDAKTTATFYKENFGFSQIRTFTKPDWDGSATIMQLEGMQLEIFQFKSSIKGKDDCSNLKLIGLRHISIQVNSVKEKYAELKRKGIDIDKPVKGTTCAWFCFLRDPDGIPIELYEPK